MEATIERKTAVGTAANRMKTGQDEDKQFRKDCYWFQHNSNAHREPAIVALLSVHSMAGYGRYNILLEHLREQEGYRLPTTNKFWLNSLAQLLQFTKEDCANFIDDLVNEFELLAQDETYIWCPELSDKMKVWDEKKQRLSERGRKGAEVTNAKKSGTSAASASAQAKESSGTSEKKAGNNNTIQYRTVQNKENRQETQYSFECFWNMYGKKVGKENAIKVWQKLSDQEQKIAIEKAPIYAKATKEKKFQKAPERWLKGKHFNDEIISNGAINIEPTRVAEYDIS